MLMRVSILACALGIIVLGSVSCRQHDMRTAAIYVPALGDRACADVISKVVSVEQGISPDNFSFDPEARMIYIRYNSLNMSLKNLEFSVAKAGFQANDIPPEPKAQAKLPESCR